MARDVWAALGDVNHYIEPFAGSLAVLLARPHAARLETVNDFDGLLANFWRAIRHDPDAVAHHADWPVNESDLHARHLWLVNKRETLTARLMADPDWFDAKAAGWWVWGACSWIGGGWCSGNGPWIAVDGEFIDRRQPPHLSNNGQGIKRRLPHLSRGQGVNRKLPHLGDNGRGIKRQRPHLSNNGQGINRQRPRLSDNGRRQWIKKWFAALSARLRDVRVACGDWSRVTGPSVLRAGNGVCGVFLDPPYDQSMRDKLYACDNDVAKDVLAWAKANGGNQNLRIVVAGYDGEHNDLEALGWRVQSWKAHGGYAGIGNGRGRENAHKERLWLSPHCIQPALAASAGRDQMAMAV